MDSSNPTNKSEMELTLEEIHAQMASDFGMQVNIEVRMPDPKPVEPETVDVDFEEVVEEFKLIPAQIGRLLESDVKTIKLFEYPFTPILKEALSQSEWTQVPSNLNRFVAGTGRVLVVYSEHLHYYNEESNARDFVRYAIPEDPVDLLDTIDEEWTDHLSRRPAASYIDKVTFRSIHDGYKFPFAHDDFGQMVFDADNRQVLDIRGWGHLQYKFKDANDAIARQNQLGQVIVELLNENAAKFGIS